MKFFHLVWKNVFRKKTRAFLTMGSIILVMVLIVVLVSLLDALAGEAAMGTLGASRIVVQHATGLSNFLPLAYRQKIEQIPAVLGVAPEIWFGGTYIDQRPEHFFGQLSTDPEIWPLINADVAIDPQQLRAWQSERDSFIAGQQLIDRYHWKLGERIHIQGSYILMDLDLVLRGVYKGRDESNIFFNTKYLENSWAGRSSQTGIFFLRVRTADDVPRVTEAINQMFENSDAPVKAMPEKEFNLQFLEMMGNVKLLVRSIAIVVLFTIVLIVANTMAMSARERVGEIAVIRALGFRSGQVLRLVLSEALVLSLLGGLAGVVVAFPFAAFLVEVMKRSPVAPFAYNFRVAPLTVLTAMAISVVIGTLSGFVPAIRSSRISIVNGLRQVV
ncbi:MAG TPA: ABC transporter permease [Candidatus Polarisedimenticolia bacterium]|nr:ABC transporter permease [Candidatus Polarisedimenticolia bacterium]